MFVHLENKILLVHFSAMRFQNHSNDVRPSRFHRGAHIAFSEIHMSYRDHIGIVFSDDHEIFVRNGNELSTVLDGIRQTVMLLFDDHLFQVTENVHIFEHGIILAPVSRIPHQNCEASAVVQQSIQVRVALIEPSFEFFRVRDSASVMWVDFISPHTFPVSSLSGIYRHGRTRKHIVRWVKENEIQQREIEVGVRDIDAPIFRIQVRKHSVGC